jgi:hypothetical protein
VEVSKEHGDEKKQWIIGIWKSKKCGAGICNRLNCKRNRERKPIMIKIGPGFPGAGGRNE